MSRAASPARVALQMSIERGMSGTYETLAALVGMRPEAARAALKEMSRAGKAQATCRQRTAGRPGASPAVFGAPKQPIDALDFAQRVWR